MVKVERHAVSFPFLFPRRNDPLHLLTALAEVAKGLRQSSASCPDSPSTPVLVSIAYPPAGLCPHIFAHPFPPATIDLNLSQRSPDSVYLETNCYWSCVCRIRTFRSILSLFLSRKWTKGGEREKMEEGHRYSLGFFPPIFISMSDVHPCYYSTRDKANEKRHG